MKKIRACLANTLLDENHKLKNYLEDMFAKHALTSQKCIFSLMNLEFVKHDLRL
jgi:hypothetical protein